MKNLQSLLLAFCMTIGFVSTTYAEIPPVDAIQDGVVADGTYTYTVPNTTGQSWTWTVIDKDGGIIDGTDGEFDLVDVTPGTPLGYTKNITWNQNGTFYVLVETTIDLTGCTNQYAIQVNVAANDYVVAFNTATVNTYCADDARIASGMEITLDVSLAGIAPAAAYYDMTAHYQVDGGTTQLATIGVNNKFNIPAIVIADAVNPAMTSVTVKLLKLVDTNGVEFSPATEDFVITINPIPAKPEITF